MFAKLLRRLHLYLAPHHHNNFRAKLIQNSGYLALIGIFLSFNLAVRLLDSSPLHILGFTSSITIDEVVAKTNAERLSAGLSPLKLSDKLSDAARRKAANMFEENYWAHNSPSGKTPWVWFSAAGYQYTHAGENLAKDFGSTDRLMAAWMASPTHKANIVNAKFQDIGIAVVPGSLQGQDTVLVVQLFGTTAQGAVAPERKTAEISEVKGQEIAKSNVVAPTPAPSLDEVKERAELSVVDEVQPPSGDWRYTLNEFDLKKYASLATTILLILVLVFDLVVAEFKSLSRRVGKNWAHIMFINVILIVVTIVNAGRIM